MATNAASNFHFAIESIHLKSGDIITPQDSGVTAIVGANNSGKSTILRDIHRLLHANPLRSPIDAISIAQLSLSTLGRTTDLLAWLDANSSKSLQGDHQGYSRPNASFIWTDLAETYWTHRAKGLGDLASFLCFYGSASERFSMKASAQMRDSIEDPPSHPIHYLQDSRELRKQVSGLSELVFNLPLTLDTLAKTITLRVGHLDGEAPAVDAVDATYTRQLAQLSPLDEQGDGIRSYFAQILPVITANFPLILLDEPEAFLHPPQARSLGAQLGRLSSDMGIQIIVSTHDRNFLTGLLESRAAVSIVRLSRLQHSVSAFQLKSDSVITLWQNPVLKYSNALDGLFHRLTILAESDGDCAYLGAALDSSIKHRNTLPNGEVLFIPSSGKAGMARIAQALTTAQVPVIAAPDLDILSSEPELSTLVRAMGGVWTDGLHQLWQKATCEQRAPRQSATVGQVVESINLRFDRNSKKEFTRSDQKDLKALTRTDRSPWEDVKRHGINAFNGDSRKSLLRLLDEIENLGIVPLRAGELECLAPEVSAHKGPNWLHEALSSNAQANGPTQDHLDRLITAGMRLLERSSNQTIETGRSFDSES